MIKSETLLRTDIYFDYIKKKILKSQKINDIQANTMATKLRQKKRILDKKSTKSEKEPVHLFAAA